MYKRIILIVFLALALSTAGYAFAQEPGGGGLMFEPPFLTAQVADQAVFRLENFELGEGGAVSFDLHIGAGAAEKSCALPVMNGFIDADSAADAVDCDELAYRAAWDRSSIPANAEVIRVSLVSRMTGFRSIAPMPDEPVSAPVGWGAAYHSPLMISFYGEDGAAKTDLTMEGNLALATNIRTKSSMSFKIAELSTEGCKTRFDSIVEIEPYAERMNEDYRLTGKYVNGEFADFGAGGSERPTILTSRQEIDSCPDGAEVPELQGITLDFSVPTVQVEYLTEAGEKGIWQGAILNFFAIDFLGL